jgi:hypothetical protein
MMLVTSALPQWSATIHYKEARQASHYFCSLRLLPSDEIYDDIIRQNKQE